MLKGRAKVILLSLVLVLVLGTGTGWYYFYGPCGTKVIDGAADQITSLLTRWLDAARLADTTSRIALSGPVSSLQQIRRDTDDIQVPSCLRLAKGHMVVGMDYAIDGFLLFMGEASDDQISSRFDLAEASFGHVVQELTRIKECAPFCD